MASHYNSVLFALCLALAAQTGNGVRAATFEVEDLEPSTPSLVGNAAALPNLNESLDDEAKNRLADALLRFGRTDFTGAEAAARALTESHPQAPEGWYTLGLALANLGRPDEAILSLDEAAARYKKNAEPLILKGDILFQLKRTDEAAAAWNAATLLDSANFRAYERLAALAEGKGDRQGALDLYLSSTNGDGTRSYPRIQAARLALLLGRPAQAEGLLTTAAKADDADDLVLDYLGRAKIGLDKTGEARTLFTRLTKRGTNARAFTSLAKIEIANGRLQEAHDILARGEAAFPGNPLILRDQGSLLGAEGKYKDAMAKFEAALETAPDEPTLLKSAGLASLRLGQRDKAVAFARTLVAQPKATADDYLWLASLLESTGAKEDAAATYRTVLETSPNSFVALNNLAIILSDESPDEALKLAQRAADLAPTIAAVRDTLGWAQLKAGQLDAAAATFEALHAADPKAALAAYRLGVVRLEQGKADEGRALLQEALALDPGFSYAAEAKSRLN